MEVGHCLSRDPQIHSCTVSSCLYSPTQEAQHSREMGRSWGSTLLGAAELALKSPKTGGLGDLTPLSWQRWVPQI